MRRWKIGEEDGREVRAEKAREEGRKRGVEDVDGRRKRERGEEWRKRREKGEGKWGKENMNGEMR